MTRKAANFRLWILLILLGLTACSIVRSNASLDQHAIEKELDTLLEISFQQNSSAGVSLTLVLPNGDTVTAVTGYANKERGILMDKDTVMLAGSIGKTYVAAVSFALANKGYFSLDDRVEQWLGNQPWYSAMPNSSTMRIDDLLRHRSGLPHHLGSQAMRNFYQRMFSEGTEKQATPVKILSQVRGTQALFEAGAAYQYSDLNYLMLGLVIEAASGDSYFDVLRELFLTPLALDNTFVLTGPSIPRLASGYLEDDDSLEIPSPTIVNGTLVYNPVFEWTGGGLATTSGDLARWIWLLYSGRAMQGPYIDQMLREPSDVADTLNDYASGVRLYRDMAAVALGHGGLMPGYQSFAVYFPSCKLGLAMQVNDEAVNIKKQRIEFINRLLLEMRSDFQITC